MSTNSRVMSASPVKVWEVLCDGWLYPLFVVGATRMREVDPDWPAVGSRLHHSVGTWPLVLDDETEVLECEAPRRLVLKAHAWPGGAAHVQLTIEPHPDGSLVEIEEDAVSGPGRLLPKPLRDVQLAVRNVETLKRLAFIAEGRP